MNKAILYFTRKEKIIKGLGVSTRHIKKRLTNNEIELIGYPADAPKVYLVNDQLTLADFKAKIWTKIRPTFDQFAFIYHSAPATGIINFLSEQTELSQKGSHQRNLDEGVPFSFYEPLLEIIETKTVSDSLFEKQWNKLVRLAKKDEDIDEKKDEWLASIPSLSDDVKPNNNRSLIYIDNLTKPQKTLFQSYGINVLTPQEITNTSLTDEDNLVIWCGLSIDIDNVPVKPTGYYGIEFAQQLRREGFKGKILFVSPFSREELVTNKPNNGIINTIGHSYIGLTNDLNQWYNEIDKIKVLSAIEWYDIERHYCNKDGLAQQTLHQIQVVSEKNGKTAITTCIKNIGLLYNTPVQDFIDKLSFDDLSEAQRKTKEYCNKIIASNADTDENTDVTEEKKPWSILLLDDEVHEEHDLVLRLKERVKEVYCATNAKDAKKILQKDYAKGGRIALVISDYRLEQTTNNVKVHQETQGYKFLIDVSQMDGLSSYVALAAISALPRKFLLQSFKRMGIRVDVYSKIDYFGQGSTLKILVDELIDKGQEAYSAIVRLPRISSSNWTHYEPFYSHHRKSIEYYFNEMYIAEKAKNYCYEYMQGGELSIKLEAYSKELTEKKAPEKLRNFKEFLEKMVCRRAVLWYSQMSSEEPIYSSETILPFLKGNSYTGREKASEAKANINTNLALRLMDYPWNITIEEKHWLYTMGLNSNNLEQIETQENEILNFVEKRMATVFKNLHPYLPNTFSRCKSWITKAIYTLDNIEQLLSITTAIYTKIGLIENPSNSLRLFYGYSARATSQLRRIKDASEYGDLPKDIEETKSYVIAKARKKFSSKTKELLESIETTALIFFHDLEVNGKKYKNNREYYRAFEKNLNGFYEFLKNEPNKQTGEYSDEIQVNENREISDEQAVENLNLDKDINEYTSQDSWYDIEY